MTKRKYYPEIGKTYGDLTVISNEIQYTKDGKVKYKVRCKCGTEFWIRAYFLEVGRQTCCKSCSQRYAVYKFPERGNFLNKTHEGIGDLTKTEYNHYKRNAKRRGIEWNVTIEDLWNAFEAQERRCALSGMDINITPKLRKSNVDFKQQTASLDRIDSSKGYVLGNIQWVHKDINKMKLDYDQDYFIDICRRIAEYNSLKDQQSENDLSDSET